MTHVKDDDILKALLDEGDDFEVESGSSEPGSEVESEHLSVHSDINSEVDAEILSSEFESDDEVPLSEVRASRQSYYTGKDKTTKWQKEQFRSNVRSRAENIITHLPGVKTAARGKLSPLECFELFISDAMTDEIVNCTNEKILSRPTGDPQQSQTTKEKIKALYGLLFLSGLARSGRHITIDLWATDGTGLDIFRDTMSKK
ncbi:unnamed protein product [Parnassius apollo]|uniref:(apollo) hypothetical protein n=1 Tax=Parnassius apollo TaxID=110799 RepID=A0A8S3WPB7_PARAO|nr:unnamed protein product [Parnassius apollo]